MSTLLRASRSQPGWRPGKRFMVHPKGWEAVLHQWTAYFHRTWELRCNLIHREEFRMMAAIRVNQAGGWCSSKRGGGKTRLVPEDHYLITEGRKMGVFLAFAAILNDQFIGQHHGSTNKKPPRSRERFFFLRRSLLLDQAARQRMDCINSSRR
jgi:hypothetical protein